jgi:hypothetical protein
MGAAMFKKLAAFAFAAMTTFAAPAFAGDQDFVLMNSTGYDIAEVYVGPTKSNSWGSDIMGSGTLDDNHFVTIKFPHSTTVCKFDLKVVYTDKDTATWSNIDLCDTSKITIFWDKKAGVSRAVTE